MKTKKKQSAFKLWFEAQFGKRPEIDNKTDEEVDDLIFLGRNAETIKSQQVIWEIKRDAALKAWVAKDLSEDEILKRL